MKNLCKIPLFLYFIVGCFIFGWWFVALRSPTLSSIAIETPQNLSLKTSALLNELSLFQREALMNALAGDFSLMSELIEQWDKDALVLLQQKKKNIQRLSTDDYLLTRILAHLIKSSSSETLRHLNSKMNKLTLNNFKKFLPQTYVSASFLLAIAPPAEILALPSGMRRLHQIYKTSFLDQIPHDFHSHRKDQLDIAQIDLAFVAPYSHPPTLQLLKRKGIPLCSIKHSTQLEDIHKALLKVGHASNHILEAQLLSLFMQSAFLNIDNRLQALSQNFPKEENETSRLLYVSYHYGYSQPASKSISFQMLTRALNHCPRFQNCLAAEPKEGSIPLSQEQVAQKDPGIIIISGPFTSIQKFIATPELQQTLAYQSKNIFFLDEDIQDSPTQYAALAYYDLYQILSSTFL